MTGSFAPTDVDVPLHDERQLVLPGILPADEEVRHG